MDESRKTREMEYHDLRYGHKPRQAYDKFYAITRASAHRYINLISSACTGKSVLDYGCGEGENSILLGKRGATVSGIDISPVAISHANKQAEELGLSGRVTFHVMDAENLKFSDNSFDLVCGTAILHHLNLEQAYNEIARVLKPNGRAVFREPLGHNWLFGLYRRLTPRDRTVDEHPLRRADVKLAERYFTSVRLTFYHLAALAAVPFRRSGSFSLVLSTMEALDRAMLRLPGLQYLAWIVMLELEGPRGQAG